MGKGGERRRCRHVIVACCAGCGWRGLHVGWGSLGLDGACTREREPGGICGTISVVVGNVDRDVAGVN